MQTIIMEHGTIDFSKMLASQEKSKKRQLENQSELNKEIRYLNEKYRELLAEYVLAEAEINRAVEEFKSKWDKRLSEYDKERKALIKKHKQVSKTIRQDYEDNIDNLKVLGFPD